MKRTACAALAAAALLLVSSAPGLCQSAPKQDGASSSPAVAPTSKRKSKTAAPSTPAGASGFAELTEQECRNLGGAVHTAPNCKATGKRCVMRLPEGQINAPCIDEVARK